MTFDLKLSSKNGERRYAAQVKVEPKPYAAKAQLLLPVKGRMIVYDGHDFYAHHRRWDYTIPFLQQLGFRTNFMRYSYDFVPVNADGAMAEGDEAKNENWFGFGREVRATADGNGRGGAGRPAGRPQVRPVIHRRARDDAHLGQLCGDRSRPRRA